VLARVLRWLQEQAAAAVAWGARCRLRGTAPISPARRLSGA